MQLEAKVRRIEVSAAIATACKYEKESVAIGTIPNKIMENQTKRGAKDGPNCLYIDYALTR